MAFLDLTLNLLGRARSEGRGGAGGENEPGDFGRMSPGEIFLNECFIQFHKS